jgi:hypothetical protein
VPNTQKLAVDNSTACEGCGSDVSPFFAAHAFRPGQADQLLTALEHTTGFAAHDGTDAEDRVNALLRDQSFCKKLVEMQMEKEIGPLKFSADEFTAPMTPEALVEAIEYEGKTKVPALATPVQSVNALLENPELYRVMARRSDDVKNIMDRMRRGERLSPLATQDFNLSLVKASTIKEFVGRLEQGQHLSLMETKLVNRFLIEANYPRQTPKMHNVVAMVQAIRTLQTRGYIPPEEIRSLLESNYPQETPRRLAEMYQHAQKQLPVSVQNQVYVANNHVFAKDGTHIHFAFSTDNTMYYGQPDVTGFNLMELNTETNKTRKIAHFYVGDYVVPHLRISTISVSPDNKKIALSITSDPITLFGASYNDMVVLDFQGQKTKVYDLGNKAYYGGWWSPRSDMFYLSCPLAEHSAPKNTVVCGLPLGSD